MVWRRGEVDIERVVCVVLLCRRNHVADWLSCGGAQDAKTHYCTVTCSDGDRINWHAHEIKWCDENKDRCPPRPAIVPVAEYKLKPWSQVVRPPMQCTRPAGGMPKITVVILAYKETESLSASLETYDAAGFLQVRAASSPPQVAARGLLPTATER